MNSSSSSSNRNTIEQHQRVACCMRQLPKIGKSPPPIAKRRNGRIAMQSSHFLSLQAVASPSFHMKSPSLAIVWSLHRLTSQENAPKMESTWRMWKSIQIFYVDSKCRAHSRDSFIRTQRLRREGRSRTNLHLWKSYFATRKTSNSSSSSRNSNNTGNSSSSFHQ